MPVCGADRRYEGWSNTFNRPSEVLEQFIILEWNRPEPSSPLSLS